MVRNSRPLTKEEIALILGVSVDTVWLWTRRFADWLSFDAACRDKRHDDSDVEIYRTVHRIDSGIDPGIVLPERAEQVRRALSSSREASSVRMAHQLERKEPDVARWGLVSSEGVCLVDEFRWLVPFRSFVTSIANFGCWASSGDTCSEPYALLWTLAARRVIVLDRNADYVRNAWDWLRRARRTHPYFQEYQVEFVVGDMTQGNGGLEEEAFELAYCRDVLYNMQDDSEALRIAIGEMARVVRPGGWVVAIESKLGADFEEDEVKCGTATLTVPIQLTDAIDISRYFEEAGLRRVDLADAPPHSYCYRK